MAYQPQHAEKDYPSGRRAMRALVRWMNKQSIGNYAGRPRRLASQKPRAGGIQSSGISPIAPTIQAPNEFCKNSEAPASGEPPPYNSDPRCGDCGVEATTEETARECRRCRGRLYRRARRSRKVGVK